MSLEDDTFIKDVREELEENMEEFFKYYNFIENHKIRNLIFFPRDEQNFFEGSVIGTLDQRYRDFYRGKFNSDMDDDVRMALLDISGAGRQVASGREASAELARPRPP